MSVNQKIKEKLQKLLALAASNNEHEATLAMEKAQTLMKEYNLSVLDVADDGSGAAVENEHVWGLTKSRQRWESRLSATVAAAFDGRAVFNLTDNGWYVTFIASRTDIAFIVDLFERLRQAVRRMSDAYVKHERSMRPWLAAKTLHNSYRQGLVRTINQRLQTLKENTRPDAVKTNHYGLTGMDLVVVKSQAVDQRVTELFGATKKDRRTKLTVYSHAYHQGQEDGNSVSLHRSIDGKRPEEIQA